MVAGAAGSQPVAVVHTLGTVVVVAVVVDCRTRWMVVHPLNRILPPALGDRSNCPVVHVQPPPAEEEASWWVAVVHVQPPPAVAASWWVAEVELP